MSESKKEIFSGFTQKAMKRLQEKKVRKYRTLYIPSLDENIKIRNLDYSEIVECTELANDATDSNAGDKYAVYLSVVEPELKEVAKELKEKGEINTYTEVTDIFELSEIQEISIEVMKLSGAIGGKKVTVVDELKN